MSGQLELVGLSKRFGDDTVVNDVRLLIEAGEFVVFVGPSGSGKSTLLRMIAGLEKPSAGTVWLDGREVTRVHPSRRGMAMVFQSYALYPHMTVAENLAFALEMAGVGKADRELRVLAVARTLEIDALLARRPRELSGGQRQRVAIGRAITREPAVFLFDEPLSNLDAELRVRMRMELAALHTRLDSTMVYVTHDQVEAMTLAERIVVLNDGEVEQFGTPMALYDDPDTRFVAGFIGSPRMNLLTATVRASDADALLLDVPGLRFESLPVVRRSGRLKSDGEITVGLRPEQLQVETAPAGAADALRVELIEQLGNRMHVHLAGDEPITVEVSERTALAPGDAVRVRVDERSGVMFDEDGRRL